MDAQESRERLDVLKRQAIPRARLSDVLPDCPPEHHAVVGEYLRGYVIGHCPGCGWGVFSWGVQHGAGRCDCGWPGVLYHFVRDDEGKEVVRFSGLLWAHPYTVHMGRRRKETP